MGGIAWFPATTVFFCCFLVVFAESSSMKLQSGTPANRMKGLERLIPMYVETTFVHYASKQNYENAKGACKRIGGRLASLNSIARQKILQEHITETWVWVDGTRNNRDDVFRWSTGEFVEPSNIPFNGNYNDYGYHCLSYYYSSSGQRLYNAAWCTNGGENPFVCEIDRYRSISQASNIYDYDLTTQFTVVQIPNKNYTDALAYCKDDIDGTKGGRLFGPTTYREMQTLDDGLAEKGVTGRWWLGAEREDFAHEPNYSNGDRIPTELGKGWETDHGGKCLIYDSSTKMFGWENCNIDDKMHRVDGFICQDDAAGKRK